MAIKIALAGNPNCGKTTLFNALTGSNQFVGNWLGVTVEKKEGKLKKSFLGDGAGEVTVMDLPGIYSLSPYTLEEVAARNYLIGGMPDAIINIVDGTNIERNLYLSTQIMELGIPVVMAVNMMDVVEKMGARIHTDKLAEKLGCEVVEISALKGTGIDKAAGRAAALARQGKAAVPVHGFSKEVEAAIGETAAKLGGGVPEGQKRFFAIKLLEKDGKIAAMMSRVPDVSGEIHRLEEIFGDDTESIITNERYEYITSIIGECYTAEKGRGGKERLTVSDRIDRVVTNRWAALPIFALVATALFGGSGLVAVSAYFLGVAAIVISGIILKKTRMFAGEPAPFVMELPAYHWPVAGNVLRSMWERVWSFIKKAGTIILLSSMVIWAGSRFGRVDGGFGFGAEMELADSVLGMAGNGIKWIFRPLGFDDAAAAIATIMGLVAKEVVVGVFGVLDFVHMTKAAAYSFLAFNLLLQWAPMKDMGNTFVEHSFVINNFVAAGCSISGGKAYGF